jgi:methylthioribose-1-phosphate isomerase
MEASNKHSYDDYLIESAQKLKSTRPTAVNLEWAVNRQMYAIAKATLVDEKINIAKETAIRIADEDASYCQALGVHGLKIIQQLSAIKKPNR